ncbi:MAG: hypothetical protein C0456_15860 [Hyphomonas sp.]|uniref:hypothetical protein n=1 Tax=Hyphomonas sp. TaxID=87 RepID=UPI001DF6BC1D|nr:hypothetical protein [Hyphomonas sp.]MBA4228098.1 hypothetical protein [Hyphomonas sp.]
MRTPIAHALSLALHPAILMPGAAGLAAVLGGAPAKTTHAILLATAGAAAAVFLFAIVQVRRGKWADADASVPEERRQLNVFLGVLLAAGAALAGFSAQPQALALGFGLSAAIIIAALALSRWLKLSLHTAFAVLAAGLFWPDLRYVSVGLALAGLAAWSRLHLRRHTPSEVLAGGAAGALAAITFQAAFAAL